MAEPRLTAAKGEISKDHFRRYCLAGVFSIVSLLVALAVSLIVTRVAAMALMFTRLSREAATFQARSAFTGAGYTTNESEMIVNHPVRRQIVATLMLLGNLGVACGRHCHGFRDDHE